MSQSFNLCKSEVEIFDLVNDNDSYCSDKESEIMVVDISDDDVEIIDLRNNRYRDESNISDDEVEVIDLVNDYECDSSVQKNNLIIVDISDDDDNNPDMENVSDDEHDNDSDDGNDDVDVNDEEMNNILDDIERDFAYYGRDVEFDEIEPAEAITSDEGFDFEGLFRG
ncbi:ciliogenesis-associated TTC17-interacting protein-like [Venturia canescens]|uniref:ciliogenesis-associated TTC17-interacting protein-like n=1 Tax=Venturia canescens TaxID=32260 RepID=UPI001C9C4B62|nr:ciliogenesis-associated TTC17-interacting protein-like [Venturia canescens]